jgi:hypothetical protein
VVLELRFEFYVIRFTISMNGAVEFIGDMGYMFNENLVWRVVKKKTCVLLPSTRLPCCALTAAVLDPHVWHRRCHCSH